MTRPEIVEHLRQRAPVNKTRRQLADEYGLTWKQMHNLLEWHGFIPNLDFQTRGDGRPPATDWDAVDWSLTDREIAEVIGCHRTTVTKQRARHE